MCVCVMERVCGCLEGEVDRIESIEVQEQYT